MTEEVQSEPQGDGMANATPSLLETERARVNEAAARMRDIRERLYARSAPPPSSVRHSLPHQESAPIPEDVADRPINPSAYDRTPVSDIIPVHHTTPASAPLEPHRMVAEESLNDLMAQHSKRSSFRKKIALIGVAFFIGALGVSAFFMLMNNPISGENISMDVSGPIAAGGGDEYTYQVAIANQNAVPVESATLIIEYPRGTKSATEENKEIFIERKPLDTIKAGELVNVQLKARVYGEENDEKEIKVSVDYRVAGSNATFHKEGNPLRFKISSSPVVISFETLKNISSGQETELKLVVQSNSPTPVENVLVKISYPGGFDFSESEPDASTGEDGWLFPKLEPGEKKTIAIRGLMTGYETDARRFLAIAGIADEKNKNTLASTLAKAQTEITLEKPFLDVDVYVNGSASDEVAIGVRDTAAVEIKYNNTLDSTIYNGTVRVELGGNALNDFSVLTQNGHYDSSEHTIAWDSTDATELDEILPGQTRTLSFSIDPNDLVGNAPELSLKVTVGGQRTSEGSVPEELSGTALRTVRIESMPTLASTAYFTKGPFTNSGPLPPVAEQKTTYTFTLAMRAGANDLSGAEVTAIVPPYVKWLDEVTEGDSVAYNTETRVLRWMIGDMKANSETEVSVQVAYVPSKTQIDSIPTLLETQRFKANDKFTGTVVRAEHAALTTSLGGEENETYHDGRVRTGE